MRRRSRATSFSVDQSVRSPLSHHGYEHERQPVQLDGRTILTYVRTTRDGLDAADLLEPEPGVPLVDVADAVLEAFPGWAVSAPPDLGRVLLERGATTIRHAHWMARDLVAEPPDPAWAALTPADPGLRIDTAPVIAEGYLESSEAAYRPGHPDYEARETPEDRMAHDVAGGLMGHSDRCSGPVPSSVTTSSPRRSWPPAWSPTDRATDPRVVEVYRRPELRYVGLGSLLLERTMAQLRQRRLHAGLRLGRDRGNPARRTYDRLGFHVVQESLTVKPPA